ncbi:MAG: nitroreductase family protein [Phycisphaerales bacterium JB038]
MSKEAQTNIDVLDLIRQRWSPYGYSNKPVPAEHVLAALEAARWAASSYNEQPWRFVLASQCDEAGYAKALGCLVEANQAWAKNAPVLLITFVKKTFARNGNPNRTAEHDLGLAVGNLSLEATRRGLYVHQMGGIDTAKAEREYGVPDDFAAVTAIAIGYREDPSKLPDEVRQTDEAPRQRRPLEQTVFAGSWGEPAKLARGV